MGLIVDGKWSDQWYDTHANKGRFSRQESAFRRMVGPKEALPPESGRYHLYVSLACPWAHRTLIFRHLKNLDDHITITVLDPLMGCNGWTFIQPDCQIGASYLYEIYLHTDALYQGRVTVPVLWDKKEKRIVNNESADIIRIFNRGFNRTTGNEIDYYPPELADEIDEINARTYDTINNGVYKAGFSTSQTIYEEEFTRVFEALDWLEARLSTRKFLVGGKLTEADWRVYTTLIRFDSVYHGHFKLNRNKLSEFPMISRYMDRLSAVPGISKTVDQDHIKRHYYGSHPTINPTGIVPLGPA